MFNQLIKESTFVVFDTETTGFDPNKEQIIEIGAVKVNSQGDVLQRFSRFIKLYRIAKLPEKIKELVNISDNMLELQGGEVHDVIEEFINFIGDSYLVAQNAKFDISFMAAYFLQNHRTTYSRVCFDTINFGKAIKPNQPSYRLSVLAPMFGVEYDSNAHHRADYDAELTAKIFTVQLGMLNLNEEATIDDLIKAEGSAPITFKQESFLNSLIERNGVQTNQMELFTKDTASKHIDLLTNLGKYE